MRSRIDEIVFVSPSGLEDVTAYTFRSTSPREKLSIELELPAGTATPAEVALADVRQQIVDHLDSNFAVVAEGSQAIAGKQGSYLHYSFSDGGKHKQGFIVIANLGSLANDGDWVKLTWLIDAPQSSVRAVVDPVLASFAKASDPPPQPTPPGSSRRQAGPWSFDLPDRYVGPRTFVWEDIEAEIRVSITVHPFDVDKPELDARVAATEQRGRQLTAQDVVPIPLGQLARLRLRSNLSGVDEEWFAIRSVQGYQVGRPIRFRWVEVAVDGPLAHEARLRKLGDDLLASIAVEERR